MLLTIMIYLKRSCLDYTLQRQMLGKLKTNGSGYNLSGHCPGCARKTVGKHKNSHQASRYLATATGNLPSTSQNRLTQPVRVNISSSSSSLVPLNRQSSQVRKHHIHDSANAYVTIVLPPSFFTSIQDGG